MRRLHRRGLASFLLLALVLSSLALDADAANAFPPGDPVFAFDYHVSATTHVKKLDQTITVTGGEFKGVIDLANSALFGAIKLPPATFTFKAAGILPLITATAQIIPRGFVTGKVDF